MSIAIPWTRIAGLTIRPQLFSGEQEGTLGGPTLPIPRLGDRFAADIDTAQLRQDAESRLLMAALFEASTGDGIIALRQPNASGRSIWSAPVVDGAAQAGSALAIRALAPGQALSRGDFFSIVHGGRHYVHMIACAGQVIADASGKATVSIWPMLRFVTTDGERCHLAAPMIEGRLVGFDKGAAFKRNRTDPLSFSIVERA